MMICSTQIQVRYSETDAMGVAHHSSYVPWLELARIRFLDHLGYSYRQMEADGIVMPVVNLSLTYKTPCVFDDLLDVRAQVNELPRSRMVVHYEVLLNCSIIATAETTLAFVCLKSRRPIRPPAKFLKLLEDGLKQNNSHSQALPIA